MYTTTNKHELLVVDERSVMFESVCLAEVFGNRRASKRYVISKLRRHRIPLLSTHERNVLVDRRVVSKKDL